MCCNEDKRKIPLAEVWIRRLVLFSIFLVISTLIGLVMMAIELTKLQRSPYNIVTAVGFSISVAGILPLYMIFFYTVCGHDQYPTAPVLIWGHALYMLIGIALVCVAQVFPANAMFHMISFQRVGENTSKVYVDDKGISENILTGFDKDIFVKEKQAIWNEELIYIIEMRLSILGGGILGIGVFGGLMTFITINRVHRVIESRKELETIRRKNIRTLTKAFKPKQHKPFRKFGRDSVYDYAGWGNRTSDIFHGSDVYEGRVSTTPSLLSTKLTSASMVSIAEEGANQQRSRRLSLLRNHEYPPEGIAEQEHEQQFDKELHRKWSFIKEKTFEQNGANSFEMKPLDKELKNEFKSF